MGGSLSASTRSGRSRGRTELIVLDFCVDLWRSARRPEILRRCATIAAVVGTILTAVNQGDLVASGRFEPALWWKVAANYLVPFVVSNLGAMSSLPPRAH